MRYIILFIIAILLPVFAFLNFSQNEGSVSPRAKEKTASVSGALGESQDAKKDMDFAPSEDVDDPKYKIPDIQYTMPSNFPLGLTTSQPYLENFKSPNFFPIRNWDVKIENPDAASALVLEPITQKALQHKNIFDVRPIASLTKLMTAFVVIEDMNLASHVVVSENAVGAYGDQGNLAPSEVLSVEALLHILLIESSNDAAIALEEYYNAYRAEPDRTFVAAMNQKAQELGLLDTFFVEPSGLNINNRSTAYDLARLADYVFQRPILRQILSTQVIDVASVDGRANHHLVNSNKLLGVLKGVLAGKTGYTEEAGESLVLFVKKSENLDDYLIYVILGSPDRVKTARSLIGWVDRAYIWE
jgi:D-alanyl-D-alanine carboxypeptidase